eukprot:1158660-Pelagomonas_calceolata.AAC.4
MAAVMRRGMVAVMRSARKGMAALRVDWTQMRIWIKPFLGSKAGTSGFGWTPTKKLSENAFASLTTIFFCGLRPFWHCGNVRT